jgi:Mg-chelatase subunit ChlD
MSLGFGGPYRTRLVFAQAAAAAYASVISQVNSQPKDSVSVFFFNDTPTQVSTFITDTTLLATQINGVQQSQGNTDLSSALSAAITALQATNASELVILVLSDGEQTDTPTQQDVVNVSSAFLATCPRAASSSTPCPTTPCWRLAA